MIFHTFVTYVGRNSTGSTRHQKGGGGQLTTQQPSKAPSASAQKRAFSFYYEQRNAMGTFLKDIRSFHDFQNIYTKKYMDINVYSFSHMLVEYELFRKTWADF